MGRAGDEKQVISLQWPYIISIYISVSNLRMFLHNFITILGDQKMYTAL